MKNNYKQKLQHTTIKTQQQKKIFKKNIKQKQTKQTSRITKQN